MKASTYNIIKTTLDGDDSLSAEERTAILRFCREPIPKPLQPAPTLPGEHYLRTREAAAVIGVSPRTIQRWIRLGTLESRQVVGSRRIPSAALRKICGEKPGANAEWYLRQDTDAEECEKTKGEMATR